MGEDIQDVLAACAEYGVPDVQEWDDDEPEDDGEGDAWERMERAQEWTAEEWDAEERFMFAEYDAEDDAERF